VLGPVLQKDLNWSNDMFALILSWFQVSYAFGYLFGGPLMDYFGVKRGYPVAALVWSAAEAVHGVTRTIFGFGAARVVLGAAEGCNFPAAIRASTDWFPVRDRTLANGIFNSGAGVGTILCPLFVPWIARHFGWPSAFYVTGAVGLLWIIAWKLNYHTPAEHPKLSIEEREYIEQGRLKDDDYHLSWLSLLGYRASWAYIVPNALSSAVWWFYLFWFPKFITTKYHLDNISAGKWSALMYTLSILGSVGAGYLASRLLQKGWSVNSARKTALLVPALFVLPVFMAARVDNIMVTVLLVGLAGAGHQGFAANLYALASDIVPKKVISSLIGLGGFAAGMAAIGMHQGTAAILDRFHSYNLIFAIAAPVYVLSVLFIHLVVPNIEQHKRKTESLSAII
jgi:ACS family hexuronate transporter-like MFS transporter